MQQKQGGPLVVGPYMLWLLVQEILLEDDEHGDGDALAVDIPEDCCSTAQANTRSHREEITANKQPEAKL
eukprot:1495019-Amphidinium_carterae.3